MLLSLIRRAVKAALHEATEEWMLETGLSQNHVAELRAQRIALAAQIEAQADSRAALALNVDDDEEDAHKPLALPMPSAARVTGPDACPSTVVVGHDDEVETNQEQEGDGEPESNVAEDADLMVWVHQQREAKVGWDVITQEANARGFNLTKKALGLRYLRWRKKTGHGDQAESVG